MLWSIVSSMDSELLKQEVTEFLTLLGAELDDVSVSTGHRTLVAITSPASKALIGPHGEHLRALNVVLRRLIEQKYGERSGELSC